MNRSELFVVYDRAGNRYQMNKHKKIIVDVSIIFS